MKVWFYCVFAPLLGYVFFPNCSWLLLLLIALGYIILFAYGVVIYRATAFSSSDKTAATVLSVIINLLLTPYIGLPIINILIKCDI